ncbi:hypothetical protein [Sediminibacterium sp.]|uniref:hypothetical protein n=1 Tax=Sediminibacterium sp. TaxID=1917865 RepID=UPI0025FA98C6|nr:hypothetical protein [Sediminibacterium sp.]MBW0178297.1 hypothetical protein [Sediminibacterium sp.]
MEYRDHLAECDKIIPEFLNTNFIARDPRQVIEINLDPRTIAIDQFIADGFLVERRNKQGIYDLTAHGRDFIRRGGYKARFEEEEKLKKINKDQIQSIIDTNRSVIKTNTIQKWSLIITCVIIGLSCYYQYQSFNLQRKQDNQQTLRLQSDSLKEVYLMVKIHSIQKQLDSMQKQKTP